VSREFLRDARSASIGAVVAGLIIAAPAMGSAVVRFARNADKVDGKDAVGSGATLAGRKGKLVATSPKTGRLPNNIIAKAPNANKLDGRDYKAFALKAGLGSAGTINESGNPVHWTKLKGVPNGFTDRVDGIGPLAYAHVNDAGFVATDMALGIEDGDIETAADGVYCFTLSFAPAHVQVTPDRRLASGGTTDSGAQPFASFNAAAVTNNCGVDSGADAVVLFLDDAGDAHNASFFVSFM
jgi:hypothetical protein